MISNRSMFDIKNVSLYVIVGDSKEVVCTKCADVVQHGENGKPYFCIKSSMCSDSMKMLPVSKLL